MIKRKPVNITPINKMGYVAIRCAGFVSMPSFGKPGKMRFAMIEKPCNKEFAGMLGNENKCKACGTPNPRPLVTPKPFENRAFRNAYESYEALVKAGKIKRGATLA